ncbi:MAG: hypothetical protein HY951_18700 [Bacteroidia bacterium]|nr:hypothetical protein [Bacteroidia bacterium]
MKKIKSIQAWVDNGDETYMKECHEYDENGKEIARERYFSSDSLEEKTLTKYNEEGLIVEEINIGEDGEVNDKTAIHRDSNGLPTEIIVEYLDGSKTIKTYSRQDNNKTTIVTEVSDEGEFEGKVRVKVDDKGHIVENAVLSENDELVEQHLYEFDEKGNILKELVFEKSQMISETKYIYDENMNLVKRIMLNPSGDTIDWAIFRYDANGNISEQQYGDHTLYKLEYNEKGKVVKEQKVNAMGMMEYSKSFEYNEEGDLMKEDNLMEKTTYKYIYYE